MRDEIASWKAAMAPPNLPYHPPPCEVALVYLPEESLRNLLVTPLHGSGWWVIQLSPSLNQEFYKVRLGEHMLGDCPQTWFLIFSWVPDSFKILIKAMAIYFPEKCTIANICIQLQGIPEAPGSLSNLQENLLIYLSRLRT